MEFWDKEVTIGEKAVVKIEKGKVLHLSQASLGEDRMGIKESICLYIHLKDKPIVIATLHAKRLRQQLFNLVLYEDFEISHNWEKGNVHFYGYFTENLCYKPDIFKSVKKFNKEEGTPEKQFEKISLNRNTEEEKDDDADSCKSGKSKKLGTDNAAVEMDLLKKFANKLKEMRR